jgi:hypothetical protein
MTLHFVAAYGCAVDSANSLVIYPPRMEPGPKPDEIEYQYSIYKNDDTRDGLGFFGLHTLIEEAGETVRLFTMDLGQPQVINSMLNVKERLQVDGDGFDFIRGLAEGLVKAFESRTDNTEAFRYVALTQEGPLQNIGLVVPAHLPRLSNGQVVLAEVLVEAHPIVRSVP